MYATLFKGEIDPLSSQFVGLPEGCHQFQGGSAICPTALGHPTGLYTSEDVFYGIHHASVVRGENQGLLRDELPVSRIAPTFTGRPNIDTCAIMAHPHTSLGSDDIYLYQKIALLIAAMDVAKETVSKAETSGDIRIQVILTIDPLGSYPAHLSS